jgi:hypothetical protein
MSRRLCGVILILSGTRSEVYYPIYLTHGIFSHVNNVRYGTSQESHKWTSNLTCIHPLSPLPGVRKYTIVLILLIGIINDACYPGSHHVDAVHGARNWRT